MKHPLTFVSSFCLLATFLTAFSGCEKEMMPAVPPPPPAKKDTVALLWAVPMDNCYQPIIYQDLVGFPNGINDDFLVFVDSASGGKVWTWDDEDYKIHGSAFGPDETFLTGDKLSACNWHTEVVIDLTNRRTHWHRSTRPKGEGEPRCSVINGHYYHFHRDNNKYANYLVRTPVEHPQWDTLYATKDSLWDPQGEPPSLFVNAAGDSLLLFIEGAVAWKHPGGPKVRISIKALNLRTRQIQWERIDFEPDRNCNTQRIIVHDGLAYKLGNSTVWCFDAETGAIVWSRDFDPQKMGYDHFMGVNGAVVHGNWVIAKTAHYRMAAMDLKTGAVAWEVNNALASNYPLRIYKNRYVIYGMKGNGGIGVHRLSDGKLVYHLDRLKGGNVNGDIAIDHAADRIYWSDGAWAYCFRLKLP